MKTKIFALIVSVIIMLAFTGCINDPLIIGNGEITEETRTLPDFTKVTSSGSYNIYWEHSDSTEVKIICESNILPYIETAVYSDHLDIRTAFHVRLSTTKRIDVIVRCPKISKIELSGSGNIETDTVRDEKLELIISGSGNIYSTFYGDDYKSVISGSGNMDIYAECKTTETDISGSGKIMIAGYADYGTFNISGSGTIKAYDFFLKEANVNISGSGTGYINASEKLDVVISGTGDIYYIGDPEIDYSDFGPGNLINDN